jgi:hypothetical protein
MRAVRVVVVAAAMALARCASAPVPVLAGGPPKAQRPTLVLRASRLIALPGQPITLTAEVVGDSTEAMYCPTVVWSWPDGTESSTESDCPPWAPGVEMERRWTKHGSLAAPGKYLFGVRLEKPRGHVLVRQTLELVAAGME